MQTGILDLVKDPLQIVDYCLKHSTKDDYIAQVDNAALLLQPMQNLLNEAFEGHWHFAEAKGHHLEFVKALAGDECRLLFVIISHLDLPVT